MAKKSAKKKNGSTCLQQEQVRTHSPNLEDRSSSSTTRNGSTSPRQVHDTITSDDGVATNGKHGSEKEKPTSSSRQAAVSNSSSSTPSKSHSKVGIFLRTLVLDIPLLLIFITYISFVVLHHVHDEYLVKQAELMFWSQDRSTPEITYYDRTCSKGDITTNTTADLLIPPTYTPTQCMHHIAKHGVSLYPNVLQEDTATLLRDWIVEHNKIEQGFWVISGEHRFTFGIGVNQAPIVSQALKEIASHPIFRPAIEEICGPNPAVIEFTAITSEYGAKDQFWHQDTLPVGSSFKHARSFVPSYSLFIPLQDTSSEIGATEICPGSHVCNGKERFCVDGGFRASQGGVWHKSTGALVNQHLFHRGMAHTDPNGLDRVLFILTFAPRPLVSPDRVETRLISMGGSYSLNWRQWGHTLNDFGNATTKMREPWKTMRSLGMYKPRDADWGWDMPAVASMRIINDDNGYHDSDLEAWLDEKGGFSFIPRQLQAEFDEEAGWPGFLETTLVNCEQAAEKLYFLASGIYLILFLSIALYQRLVGKRDKGSPFGRAMLRIVVTHAIVVALACYAVYRVSNTSWAQHIRQGRQFAHRQLTEEELLALDDGMLPGTLPYKYDVLAETKYDSEYLYGTSYIIENSHPGNIQFIKMLKSNSIGYEGLSPALKAHLTMNVVDWMLQDMGRFLTQNEEGNWAEMPLEQAQKTVHKEFLKQVYPLVAFVLKELSYLVSETKFGSLRDTAMHRRHIPAMLDRLQDDILDSPPFVSNKNNTVATATSAATNTTCIVVPSPSVCDTPSLGDKAAVEKRQYLLPPVYEIQEPYPCAWAQEGDVVEAKYNGVYNEWYRATIIDMDVNGAAYDVQYDDGEVDEYLCRRCIRPYVALQVDEEVEVRGDDEEVFHSGRVVQVHADGTVDIDAGKHGLFENVSAADTRRVDPAPELEVGSPIEALYQAPRGRRWFEGQVRKIHPDGSCDILYEDGDEEFRVKRKYIRPLV